MIISFNIKKICIILLFIYFSIIHPAFAQQSIENARILNFKLNDLDEIREFVKIENRGNKPRKVKGVIDSALEFDKTAYLDYGSENSIKNRDSVSIEAWIKAKNIKSPQADTVIVMKGDYAYGLTRDERSGNLVWAYINRGGNNISAPIETNTWQHIVLTYDRNLNKNNMKVFVNGVMENVRHLDEPIPNNQDHLYVAGNGKQNFNGAIDNVNIYNRALSGDEVWDLFKNGVIKGNIHADLKKLAKERESIQKIIFDEGLNKKSIHNENILKSYFIFLIIFLFLINKYTKFNIFQNDIVYIIIIIIYAILLTLQINLYPGERYPGWDHFWGDTRTMGKLFSLSYAIKNFELPCIVPYTNLGWNLAGDSDHLFGILNFLVIFFSPANVIYIIQIIFLILGGAGAYLLLRLITKGHFISFTGGLFYISTPFLISLTYYSNVGNIFYSIPLLLFLLHKVLKDFNMKHLFFFLLYSFFIIGSSNIYVFIVLPPVVFLYSLIIGNWYYESGFLKSIKKTIILVFLFLLSGSYIIVPLFYNLYTMSSASVPVLNALHLARIKTSLTAGGFIKFFYNNMFVSLYKPIEGSGALLYIPAFFYITIFISIIFKGKIFNKNSKQIIVVYALLLLGIGMFFGSILFYTPLAPGILKNSANGVLRYQINLIPFSFLLAGFICFSTLFKIEEKKRKNIIFSIIISSILIDFLFFGRIGNLFKIDSVAFEMAFKGNPNFNSSNLINIKFLDNMWLLLPILNLFFIVFLFLYNHFINNTNKKSIFVILSLIIIMIIGVLYISLYNELRLQQQAWQLLTRNSYRMDNYYKRRIGIDSLVKRYDQNYRTLYAGAGNIKSSSGRDWKLIAETELHVQNKEKVLFSYREFDHPYIGIIYGMLNENFSFHNNFPPLSKNIESNTDTLKLLGVKWVISSDKELNNNELIYIGECRTEPGVFGRLYDKRQKHEGGVFYVYQLRNPQKIAFLVDSYKKISQEDSLRMLFKNKLHPWMDEIVYLEKDPVNEESKDNIRRDIKGIDLKSEAEIIQEGFNSIKINVDSSKDKFLVLSYLFRPNWKAYIDSKETKVFRAYGGLMCIEVTHGKHAVFFKYCPYDVYIGFIISGLIFLFPFTLIFKKSHK